MSLNLRKLVEEFNIGDISEYFKKADENFNIHPFSNNKNLFLLCNNFKKSYDSDLYRECRSVVLEKTETDEKTTLSVLACSHESMIDTCIDDFEFDTNLDTVEELFEGTSVMVFNYQDTWHVCTTKCTDSYKSFFNKNKSYGQMFDECILKNDISREDFFKTLNPENYYTFIIIHHDNKYITDYTSKFGDNYAVLALGSVASLRTCEVKNVTVLNTFSPTVITIMDSSDKLAGIDGVICKRYDETRNSYKVFRVMQSKTLESWEKKPNYHNQWYCMLQIFINNDPEYSIRAYMKDHNIENNLILNKQDVDVIGMFCMLYKNTAFLLNNLVLYFTDFDHMKRSFVKKREDKFAKLSSPEHTVLKAVITSLQYAIRDRTVWNIHTIVSHLKKHTKARDFIHLLRSLKTLDSSGFLVVNNTFFTEYRDFLLELVDNVEINNKEFEKNNNCELNLDEFPSLDSNADPKTDAKVDSKADAIEIDGQEKTDEKSEQDDYNDV